MSDDRKTFWTVVARGWGGFAWPRKTGLKGTMPALVNSRVGSPNGIRDALANTLWSRSLKKLRKRWRISALFTLGPCGALNCTEISFLALKPSARARR